MQQIADEVRRVEAEDLSGASAEQWRQLHAEGVVAVTVGGEVVAVLSPACESSLDGVVRALRRARTLAEVERIQEVSRACPERRLSLNEIAARIESLGRPSRRGDRRSTAAQAER
jgi:hypothetical protein